MNEELLSQDEVDALLKGVDGASGADAPAEPSNGSARTFDRARQERIVRARMPALEMINEQFAGLLRNGLHAFLRRTPTVTAEAVRAIRCDAFAQALVVPSSLNLVQLKPLRGNALFAFDAALLNAVVESLFGGDGRSSPGGGGREPTPTEQRIAQRMLAVVLEEYAKAWHAVHPLRFEHVRTAAQPRFAGIAAPEDIVMATTFSIEFGSGGGTLQIGIPYAALEPIRDLLCATAQDEHVEPDQRWLGMLSNQVQCAEVDLTARLTSIPVPIRELLNMKIGDVVGFDLPDTVNAEVDGVPIFECRYGTLNGQYALKIERVLAVAARDHSLGENHAA